MKSAEVNVSCAFKETFIKAVTRARLMSATRSLLSKGEAKELRMAEKQLIPLAHAFLKNKIVGIRKGSDVHNLTQNCVKLIGNY